MRNSVYMFSATRTFGGGEMYMIRLAQLLSLGQRFVVIAVPVPILHAAMLEAGARFVALSGDSSLAPRLGFLRWLWARRVELQRDQAVIILNGKGAAYLAPAVRWLTGMDPVIICHTELALNRKVWKEWLYGTALRCAGTLIAVSHTVAAQHRARWPGLHVVGIPNWLDIAAVAPRAIGASSLPGPMKIATVGRLDEQKGMHDMIAVLAGMAGVEGHFYGDGPMRAELEHTAAGLAHVKVHGHVVDLEQRLPLHHILVSASYSESFSYAVAEGIGAGLLCVASDIAAHRELLGPDYPGCLFFPAGDRGRLRLAILAARAMLDENAGKQARAVLDAALARLTARNGPASAKADYLAALGVGGASEAAPTDRAER